MFFAAGLIVVRQRFPCQSNIMWVLCMQYQQSRHWIFQIHPFAFSRATHWGYYVLPTSMWAPHVIWVTNKYWLTKSGCYIQEVQCFRWIHSESVDELYEASYPLCSYGRLSSTQEEEQEEGTSKCFITLRPNRNIHAKRNCRFSATKFEPWGDVWDNIKQSIMSIYSRWIK